MCALAYLKRSSLIPKFVVRCSILYILIEIDVCGYVCTRPSIVEVPRFVNGQIFFRVI